MNKTEENYVNLYNSILCRRDFKYYGVRHFYAKPSQEKIDKEELILRKMFFDNGYCYRILCGNSYTFTCGYLVNDKYDRVWLKVFTKNNIYKILLED